MYSQHYARPKHVYIYLNHVSRTSSSRSTRTSASPYFSLNKQKGDCNSEPIYSGKFLNDILTWPVGWLPPWTSRRSTRRRLGRAGLLPPAAVASPRGSRRGCDAPTTAGETRTSPAPHSARSTMSTDVNECLHKEINGAFTYMLIYFTFSNRCGMICRCPSDTDTIARSFMVCSCHNRRELS